MKGRSEKNRVVPSRGFTLLELIITIGVAVVIAALFVPSMETCKERARKVKCISHLRAIHVGSEDPDDLIQRLEKVFGAV